jgi:hypothetical protein
MCTSVGGKAGAVKGGGHFDLTVDTLLAQNRDARLGAGNHERRGRVEGE